MKIHAIPYSPESWLVAGGRDHQPERPLNVPIIPASNFLLGGERAYSRDDGTPAWEALETLVGGLESGCAVAFASGMAAAAAVFDQLKTGAQIVLPTDCYQGVLGLALEGEKKNRWSVKKLAVEDTSGWLDACQHADLIWLESPSNPLLEIADLEKICQAPRKSGTILAVDNTFATPLNQKPLELGATFSVQSATKYIGGHSDLLSGVVSTQDGQWLLALRHARELNGATPGALETYLAIRGLRTMAVRIERSQNNAQRLAEWLEKHPHIKRVRYPGLTSHPSHALAKRSLKGFGSMVTFDVDGGAKEADAVCSSVRLIQHATSLGAVESTIERRAAVPGQQHLPPNLLRLSVGIENISDLIADLEQALQSAGSLR